MTVRLRYPFQAILLVLLALFASPAAIAETRASDGVVGTPMRTCILPARPGDDPATLIRRPDRFDCTTPQAAFGAGDFWVISQDIGVRSRSRRPLAARIASVWQDRLSLHVLYADGRLASLSDDNAGISKRLQLGAIVEHELPRSAAKVVRLMWKVEGAANVRGILLGARLATGEDSRQSNLTMALVYASFSGLAFALLIYNLALWAALRHRFQLSYCVMVALLIGYAFTSSGVLAWVVPDIANNDRLRLNYLLLGSAAAAALGFARAFFEDHVFGRRLRIAVIAAMAAMVGIAVAFAAFAPVAIRTLDPLYSATFLVTLSVVFAIMWSAWKHRSNFLWLFALAWAVPIVTATMRAFANLRLIPWNFWLDHSTVIAMAAEALISSVAIAYRIRLLSRERDQAVAAEAIARRLADTDPLTGLLNRRAFLASAIGRDEAQQLLILDLDHFKLVNETLGHDGGDEVLRTVARTLRAIAPTGALVARLGGEEFAILSPVDQPTDAAALLARLRATRMRFDLRVTASIGTAVGPLADETHWKSLYRDADSALFAAKSAGRDRARAAPLAA